MTFEAKCKIEDQVIAMFNKAIVNPDNLDVSEVDGINWNFVDMIGEYLEFGKVETNSVAA